jgi:hypothetical protein
MTEKWPTESLTEEEARYRHSDCEFINVFSIVDQYGQRRPAIFVWRREDDTDKEDPTAVNWWKD